MLRCCHYRERDVDHVYWIGLPASRVVARIVTCYYHVEVVVIESHNDLVSPWQHSNTLLRSYASIIHHYRSISFFQSPFTSSAHRPAAQPWSTPY